MDQNHHLPGTPLKGPVELTNCDREPIHIPAAVQAYGCLVVVRLDDKQVVSISSNASEFHFFDVLPKVGQTIDEDYEGLVQLVDSLADSAEGATTQQLLSETFDQGDSGVPANGSANDGRSGRRRLPDDAIRS